MTRKKTVRLFFTVDDNYVPYLSVTLASIVRHASKKYTYHLTILHDGLSCKSRRYFANIKTTKISLFGFLMSPRKSIHYQ